MKFRVLVQWRNWILDLLPQSWKGEELTQDQGKGEVVHGLLFIYIIGMVMVPSLLGFCEDANDIKACKAIRMEADPDKC